MPTRNSDTQPMLGRMSSRPLSRKRVLLLSFKTMEDQRKTLAPSNGQWDRKGTRLWLNDEELLHHPMGQCQS